MLDIAEISGSDALFERPTMGHKVRPSEMNDDELRLAIAEKLGWIGVKTLSDDILWGIRPTGILTYEGHEIVPNWSGDVVAALGLFSKDDQVDIWQDSTGWNCSFGGAFCHGKPFARALSECWLKARRNDA